MEVTASLERAICDLGDPRLGGPITPDGRTVHAVQQFAACAFVWFFRMLSIFWFDDIHSVVVAVPVCGMYSTYGIANAPPK